MASSVTLEEVSGSEGSSNRSMLTFSVGPTLERKNQVQVAMISCAILDSEKDETVLQFSTFNSEGNTLDQFSKLIPDPKAFLLSACSNLLLITGNPSFLCNIATREMVTLPNTPGNDSSCGVTGFGYVPSTKEFKVLADLSFGGSGFKVLTLGVNRWGDVEDPPFYVEGYGNAFVNGAIHFQSLAESRHTPNGFIHALPENKHNIATFNLEREEWGSMTGPIFRSSLSCLMNLSGYLCMVDTFLKINGRSNIDIWQLKDYNKSLWVKVCNIPYSALNHDNPFMVDPLAIEADRKVLVQVDGYSLQLYDPKTRSSREIIRFKEVSQDGNLKSFDVKVFSPLGNY